MLSVWEREILGEDSQSSEWRWKELYHVHTETEVTGGSWQGQSYAPVPEGFRRY